jgi:hypothetical protein
MYGGIKRLNQGHGLTCECDLCRTTGPCPLPSKRAALPAFIPERPTGNRYACLGPPERNK